MLTDAGWIKDIWADARDFASREARLEYADFPENCRWPMKQARSIDFYPDAPCKKAR